MENEAGIKGKHDFFTVFLIVIYIIGFLFMFGSYKNNQLQIGPIVLGGISIIIYTVIMQLFLGVIIVGLIRRTKWIFITALIYQLYGIVNLILNRFIFKGQFDNTIKSTLDLMPDSPVITKDQMLSLMSVIMNITIVLTFLFSFFMVIFLFLAKKRFEKERLI